ncbi:hypothetical protein RAS2_17220 [Phycisphaerae bacterium RAS2]|nr:hypothetical protein RAS2_17220 [Phycisphaerae bacterium RAS2]
MNSRLRIMVLGAVAALAVSTVGAATAEAGGRCGPRRGGYSYSYSRSWSDCGPRFAAPRYCPPVRSWGYSRSWNDCGPRYSRAPRSVGFSFNYSRGGWGRGNRCGW